MRYSTNNPPPPRYYNYPRPSTKNWACPRTLLTSRSTSRTGSHHRLNPINLTKTCPFCPSPSNLPRKLNPPYYSRPAINTSGRLRGPKPNPAPKNPCLFLHRPSWMNNPHPTIFPLPNPSSSPYIPRHDILNIPCI